eukprot:9783567-Lingulodinium_polyedra.AAC.1
MLPQEELQPMCQGHRPSSTSRASPHALCNADVLAIWSRSKTQRKTRHQCVSNVEFLRVSNAKTQYQELQSL